MKLDVAVNEITLSNVGATGEFRIRNSAKAFKILSDGLYSNKIRAIIRELSCNALDSHVAAGNPDVPFEVHLPTVLEPWFSVKDFGLGLDGNQVTNIYTTYFESTKTDSNDFVGALGLGSKSPFSYTENFTVIAIKGGTRRIYSAFINDMGVPSIAEMETQLTDEPNGVEVKFSVTDRYDYNSFRHEAQKVFMWFTNKPVITGVDHFTIPKLEFKIADIVPGVHQLLGYESMALMGNIAYPLNNISEPQKHFGSLAKLLDSGLLLEFPIGALDFAASREELSYVPMTIKSIKAKLEELNANLTTHLATRANAIKCEWERAEFLYKEQRNTLFASAVTKYVADTKFALYDTSAYHGVKTFRHKVSELEKDGISIGSFRSSYGSVTKISHSNEYVNQIYCVVVDIPVSTEAVFVLNDLKTGCMSRARYHFSNTHGKSVTVHCISHNSTDLEVRNAAYEKLLKGLHNPPVVMKASELEVRVRQKTMSIQGITTLGLKANTRMGYESSYTWRPYTEALDENTTYYYVCLNGYQPVNEDGTEFEMFKIKALMDQCGISDIANIEVFGVRKNRIKEIQDLDNWIKIEDKLKEETAKISDTHITSLVISEIIDQYYNRVYTNSSVAKKVGPDSDYAKFYKDYASVKRASGNVSQLVALCGMYGKAVQVVAVKDKIENAKNVLMVKYPMLKYANNAGESDVAEYIKLIDSQVKS